MKRRSFLAGSLSLAALPVARPAAAAESIRVGYLGPQSGIFAQAGKDMLDGLKMAFEQVNYQAAGRKIELIEEDTEGNPATAQAKYRKLVQQDKIHALTGVLLANIGYALVQPIERDTLPSLFLTTPDDLTKRRPTKWLLRSNFSASQPMHPLGDEAIGVVGSLIWAPTLQNPANQTFMKLAEAKGKNAPAYFTAVMYSAGRWITEAARVVEGQVEDRARFLGGIRRASETTPDPRGPIKLDEYGNPTQNVYILKVERANGKLQNTVIDTYPMGSQS